MIIHGTDSFVPNQQVTPAPIPLTSRQRITKRKDIDSDGDGKNQSKLVSTNRFNDKGEETNNSLVPQARAQAQAQVPPPPKAVAIIVVPTSTKSHLLKLSQLPICFLLHGRDLQ